MRFGNKRYTELAAIRLLEYISRFENIYLLLAHREELCAKEEQAFCEYYGVRLGDSPMVGLTDKEWSITLKRPNYTLIASDGKFCAFDEYGRALFLKGK